MKSIVFFAWLGCVACAAQAGAPAVQTVAAGRMVAAARAALPAAASGVRVTVRPIGKPTDAVVPAGPVTVHAQAPEGRWPRARVAVPVSILLRGSVVRTDTVWFAVRAMRGTWVYSKDEPVGTPVVTLKPKQAPVDIAATNGTVIDSPAALANERLVRGVQAGWPVLRSDFEPIPAVDAQSRVVVHLHHGPIRLEAQATALDAGNIGDVVSVLVNGAVAPVQAKVAAKGVVNVAY